jgi:hypothetical protein
MAALFGASMASQAATSPTGSTHHHHKAHHTATSSHHATAQEARADALDRMHMQTAALRDADQQHQIVRDLNSGRVTPAQAAMLEQTQAKILTDQAALQRHGHESVDEALRLQHEQDVQDWAIHAARVTSTVRT